MLTGKTTVLPSSTCRRTIGGHTTKQLRPKCLRALFILIIILIRVRKAKLLIFTLTTNSQFSFSSVEDLGYYPEQLPEEDAAVYSQPSVPLHQTPVIPCQQLPNKDSTTTAAGNMVKDSKPKVKAKRKQKAGTGRVLTEIACLFCRRRHIKCGGPKNTTRKCKLVPRTVAFCI